jgi:flavodoxin
MRKVLIAYYSFEGNTKFIAESMAKAVKADLLEIKPVKELKSKGLMKYFWGGKQATMKEKPALRPIGKDLSKYDTIFIGTPVWAFTFSPPIRSFLSQKGLQGKKIALFATHEGHLGKTIENMGKELKGSKIIGKAGFMPALGSRKEYSEKAAKWARSIIQ